MSADGAPLFDVEFQLLLACSQTHTDRDLIRNLANQTKDWGKVARYAQQHGLTMQICQKLDEVSLPLASRASELVKCNIRQIAQQNLLLTAELLRVMRAFGAENIPAIPYKGPILAATTYGDLGMRSFCDLDVLVSEKDVARVLEIMPGLGYRAEFNLAPGQESRYLRSTCEYNFRHDRNRIWVEIHWQVIPPRFGLAFEFEQLWCRAGSLSIGGSELRVLSREDELLVLSVHGFKHLWDCLKWVCDVANLLSSPEELDWGYTLREADRIGALRVVLVAVSLANQMFQSCLPDTIRLRLRDDPAALSIAREVVSSYSRSVSMSRMKARLLMLRAYSGFRHRATYVMRSLLEPTTEELIRSPERPMFVMRAQQVFRVGRQAFPFCANRGKPSTE
jgi:Uncharacterised nucleotidyltransferase